MLLILASLIEVGENLVKRGVVFHHPEHENNGWFSHLLTNKKEVEQTVWLIQLTHLLYELSERGEGDPVTQQEMERFIASEQCKQSLIASSKRWQLAIQMYFFGGFYV